MELHQHPINSRIKDIFLYFKYKDQKDFAADLNIDERIISNVLTQKTKASTNLIQSIAQKFENINLKWLLNGNGTMLENESQKLDNPNLFREDSEKYETDNSAKKHNNIIITQEEVMKEDILQMKMKLLLLEDMIKDLEMEVRANRNK